ncbi:hypothetical protein DFH27DRAFT_581127 [Peziza echinospora]|nr:hypothetical protein DFH27DRAFT_581127 [Peziza echinospora]
MGQYWEMIAHERLESRGNWGKLAEALSGHEAFSLVCRLAVPVAASRAPPAHGLPFLFSGSAPNHQTTPSTTSSTTATTRACSLLRVPPEIILLIADCLDLSPLCTLNSCCKALTRILRPHMYARFHASLAPWANTPLIYAGCAMASNPPGIVTRVPSWAGLPEKVEPYWRPARDESDMIRPADMDVYTLMQYLDPTTVGRSLHAPGAVCRPRPGRGLVEFPGPNVLTLTRYYPAGRGWALRNLTKKHYVYAVVLSSMDGCGGGGVDRPDAVHQYGFSLGTLVSIMTCWSDDDPGYPVGVKHQADWAGDCFDIVAQETLTAAAAAGEMWVDWSREAWNLMMRIWDDEENGL